MIKKTFFAVAEKADRKQLDIEISLVSQNALVTGLLQSVSGILAVVNDKRQVVAVNDSFTQMLGINNPEDHLGLRPGEILQCTEAEKEPGGCGTTMQCRTCGAAIAMVTSLAENKPAERICAINAIRGDSEVDMMLSVRAHPIEINSSRFLLLFMQDITLQQQNAALERVFFHDINNLMSMLLGSSELLLDETRSDLAHMLHKAAIRLQQEINIQRCISETKTSSYTPMWHNIDCGEILQQIEPYFTNHPSSQGKIFEIDWEHSSLAIQTDVSLVLRILCNMVTNGFEAIEPNKSVKLWIEPQEEQLSFKVWNDAEIPEEIQGRIFQRNFSTKAQSGRGIGTFSMKLLGEKILGGKVSFTSSAEDGTCFSLTLPS